MELFLVVYNLRRKEDIVKSFSKKYKFILISMMILALTSCNKAVKTGNKNSETSNKICISGLEKENIEVKVDEIKKLKKVNKDVVAVTSSGERNEMNVSGGLLEELLGKYNKSQKNLSIVRFIATDGYSIDIPKEVLENRDIILAYEIDGKPLFEDSQPLRIIIPDERAMYWVKGLNKIEIVENDKKQGNKEIDKIIIFDTAILDLKQEDYKYYESVDKAIKTNDLLTSHASDNIEDEIFIKAADGLEKSESNKVFRDAYIKTTGKDSPIFLSSDMPKGMTVKDILWFSTGSTSFLSISKSFEYFDESNSDNIKGILFKDIMDDIDLTKGNTYIFVAKDGYKVEVSSEDANNCILYKNEDNKVVVYFSGLEKSTSVKDLLFIEVKR